jgi:hypothetical protein
VPTNTPTYPSLPPAFPVIEDERPLPEPTMAPAGSAEKLAEFVRRARLDMQLFHPNDCRDGARKRP